MYNRNGIDHSNTESLHSYNESSAVAEIGDRLATVDMGRKEGAAAPLSADGNKIIPVRN